MSNQEELSFTLRIHKDLAKKLDYIASYNDRSRNSEINQAIKRHILAFEKSVGKIDQEEEK